MLVDFFPFVYFCSTKMTSYIGKRFVVVAVVVVVDFGG